MSYHNDSSSLALRFSRKSTYEAEPTTTSDNFNFVIFKLSYRWLAFHVSSKNGIMACALCKDLMGNTREQTDTVQINSVALGLGLEAVALHPKNGKHGNYKQNVTFLSWTLAFPGYFDVSLLEKINVGRNQIFQINTKRQKAILVNIYNNRNSKFKLVGGGKGCKR